MYSLTEKLVALTPYDPVLGDYRIRLDANESFIDTSDKLLTESVTGSELNRYPDPYAKKLIDAYADLYDINPDFITAGNGSDELISIVTACFLKKGEKLLCFSPDFSMYSFYGSLYELEIKLLQKENNLKINVDKAIEMIKNENIKAVIFSNPCNPTSLGLDKESVIKLVSSVDALVILDEAYMDFWGEENSLLRDVEGYDNLIVLRTCSKALGMAGLRLGFAVSNALITKKLRAAKSPYNVNSLTQLVAEYMLRDKNEMKRRIKLCKASINELYGELIKMKLSFIDIIYPTVTNFVFIKTGQGRELFEYLLSRSIAVRFMGDYLRITAGSSEENRALLKALNEFDINISG